VGNGAAGNLQTSDNTVFTANITPSADGAVTVDIAAGVATGSTSGETNTAADRFSITYDGTPPSPPVSLAAPTPTNDTTPTWTWASGGGGSGYRRSYDESAWTEQSAASFTPASALSDGAHTLYVQERDAAGNWSASASHSVTIDATAPSITSASLAADNSYIDVSFSEGIYATSGSGAVEASDFALTFTGNGGSATNAVIGALAKTDGGALAGGESAVRVSLTITGTPSGAETIEIKPAVNAVFDSVGNAAPTTTTGAKTLNDKERPSAVITSSQSGATADNPIPVTITFSEAVSGFTVGDIDVANGSAGNLQTSDDTVFTADITPAAGIADGSTITVDVDADVAADAAGNQNTAATTWSIVYDTRVPNAPNVGITGTTASPTNDTTPTWVWESGGGDVASGTYKVKLNALSWFTTDTTYTSPGFSDGDFTLYVWEKSAAGLWSDSGSHTITIDTTAPSAQITSTAANPTNVSPIPITITFSEAVTGFAIEDITVGNCAAGNLQTSDHTVFTADITPTADGNVTIDIDANVAVDAASNGNTAATRFSIGYDTAAPTAPTVGTSGTTPTNDATPAWTWTTGGGGSGTYRYGYTDGSDWINEASTSTAYTPASDLADGNHTLYVQERDAAGNWSASGSYTILVDTTLPTVEITTDGADDTTLVTFTFSEDVTGFAKEDVTVSSGTKGIWVMVSSAVFNLDIIHDNSADITVSIAANMLTDLAGNKNAAVTAVAVYKLITLEIVNESPLPNGVKGEYYAQNFTATGNTGALAWALKTGDLPAGMAFAADGTLTGTPTEAGTFTFTVQVTDDVATVEKNISLTVNETAPGDAAWTSGGGEFYHGTSTRQEMTAGLQYALFTYADVNGGLLTLNTDYLLTEGSTVVNLLPSYLNTLSSGTYMLTLHWSDNSTRSLSFNVLSSLSLIITQQPASTSALIGAAATFTVQAHGTPPLLYLWYADYGFGWVPLSETSSSYTIPTAELSLSGAEFRAVVYDGLGGSLTSETAVLTVSEMPQTGDTAPIGLYIVLVVFAGLGLAALRLRGKLRR